MSLQRTLLGWVVGSMVCAGALAQADGKLRWRTSPAPMGLHATTMPELRSACSPFTLSCEGETASAPLWTSARAARTVLMEVAYAEQLTLLGARQRGMNLSVVGKAGLPHALGVYGRLGTFMHSNGPGLNPAAAGEAAGLSYGLGLSWDFSRTGSASVAWDSYDLRTPGGDWRASLGLQWRY